MSITKKTESYAEGATGGKKGTKLARPSLLPFDALEALAQNHPRAPDRMDVLHAWACWEQARQDHAKKPDCATGQDFEEATQVLVHAVQIAVGADTDPAAYYLHGYWHPATLMALAELYGAGAKKYPAHNWEKGYPSVLSLDAMGRHAIASGVEELDPETGIKHAVCVLWHLLALTTFRIRGIGDYAPRDV